MDERNEGTGLRPDGAPIGEQPRVTHEDGRGRPGHPEDLLGTPPPGTVAGGQDAGRQTGAEPAPEEEDAVGDPGNRE